MSLPRAVVFDLDGTLVHSLPGIAAATRLTVEAHGVGPTGVLTDPAIGRMVGEGAGSLLARAFHAVGAPVPPGAAATWQAHYRRCAPAGTRPLPGAPALLAALRAAGVSVGLCTNKPHAATLQLLAELGWTGTFDAVRGAGAAPADKPDPRHLLAVLADLAVGRRHAWFIGDSPTDAATGLAAGVHPVLLRHGYSREPVDLLPADRHLDDLPALSRALGLAPT